MPKTTTAPETVEDRAARLSAESTAAQAELQQQQMARAAQLAEHQRAYDVALVDAWNPGALDEDVELSRRNLRATVASDPITGALSDYICAQRRRIDGWGEHLAALGRLGRPTAGAQLPPAVGPLDVSDYVARVAEQLASDRARSDREQRDNHRNGTDQQETNPS